MTEPTESPAPHDGPPPDASAAPDDGTPVAIAGPDRGCLGCDDPDAPSPEEQAAAARRAEILVASCFLVCTAAAIALAVVYSTGGQPQLEGAFLALALGGLGFGFIMWSRRFMPHEPVVEARHPIASTEEEVDAFREEFEQGEVILTRRKLLIRSAGAAVVALGAALLFPIRSLGPKPGAGLKNTPFAKGVYIVTANNQRVRPEDVNVNGVLTVFPEVPVGPNDDGDPNLRPQDQADAPTLLIRPNEPVHPVEGREDWTPDGLVAYSKLCTHVGCPVGLYQADEHLLLCPCHQSTFAVLDGAKPIFGPATRPLPQLPLALDDDGFLVADGDFSSPTGPGFWDRNR